MNISEHIPKLSSHPIFKGIDASIISKYLSEDNVFLKTYSTSSIIISPQDKVLPIYIIVSGTVEITCPAADHKVLLKTSGIGSIFGVANLYIDGEGFPSIVSAKTDVEVLIINRDTFKNMLKSETDIMNNYLVFISKKVIYLNKKIASYTVGNNEKKLAYFLYENEIDGTVAVNMSISDIAVMLDMGRASLYRAFDKLETDGLIAKDGRNIKILNKEKLKMFI